MEDPGEGTSGIKPSSVDEITKILGSIIPKSERPEPRKQLDIYQTLEVVDDRENYNYIRIKEIALASHDELKPQEAASLILELRMIRHNIWYDAIYNNLHYRWSKMDKEVKFNTFFKNIYKDPTIVPDNLGMLTPDFMFFDEESNIVFIGDVTVTNNVRAATSTKHDKYLPINDFITGHGLGCIQQDLILSTDMGNLNSQLKILRDKTVLNTNYDPAMDEIFSKSATDLTQRIIFNCSDKNELSRVMDSHDKVHRIKLDNEFYENLDHDLLDFHLDDYHPTLTEKQLCSLIKSETERRDPDKYFECSVDQIKSAFESVRSQHSDKEVMAPKPVLKVIDNSSGYNDKSDLSLVRDYINDLRSADQNNVRDYFLSLMPTDVQWTLMTEIGKFSFNRKQIKADSKFKNAQVGGKYQYYRQKNMSNSITINLESKLSKGKKKNNNLNAKTAPKTIDIEESYNFSNFINDAMEYYGQLSTKPSFLDDSWDAYNSMEENNSVKEKEIYDYCRRTNGAQLAHSLSGLYQRLTHMTTNASKYDNIYIPPNGSFIAFIPKNHAPITSRNCDLPFLFMTRCAIDENLKHIEYEYTCSSAKYHYYISKLCRLNMDKISAWDNAGYRLVASSSFLLSRCPSLRECKNKVVGTLTYFMLDVHQKVSEYLDLLKYVSFMPFSSLHMLPKLIVDKFSLLLKTRLDLWMLRRLENFVIELTDVDKLNASKQLIGVYNGIVTRDCMGITMHLPSFVDIDIRHSKPTQFIEEIAMLYTSRPKHLYGSQFIDESTTNTAKWNLEFDEEVTKYGNWCLTGLGPGRYPFDSKFAFSSDAIHYATKLLQQNVEADKDKIENHIFKGTYYDFMHKNCSLRGCTKDEDDREKQTDVHTTSIDACLKYYVKKGMDDKKCRASSIGQEFLKSGKKMHFSMSEKDQRGGGRPIATPTLETKATLMLIEKPEASIGTYMINNILVAGKNKLKEQHIAYTEALSYGTSKRINKVFQLTEDQTKYSENDNPRKYEVYIRTNQLLDLNIRKLQYLSLQKLYDRVHIVGRLPLHIKEDDKLYCEVVSNNSTLGVKARVGWPQGMLNNISTSIHAAADIWIQKMFKMAYPDDVIHARGLVHSDDSWVVVCCQTEEVFKKFALFRLLAKKLFCLKINEKKLWGSQYLGELVSNYNLNGEVYLPTSKVVCNGLNNLTYQNWGIDVSNQISTMQQAYRNGANIPELIMLSTVLRQQIIGSYNVKGLQLKHIHDLPIELGGYPRMSPFILGVSGVHAHYQDLYDSFKRDEKTVSRDLCKGAVRCMVDNLAGAEMNPDLEIEKHPDDYEGIVLPSRGEIFKAIRHIMPKSRKVAIALKTIREVTKDIESDGMGMIITHPRTLKESLGHLKDTTSNALYRMASEKYNQSIRRLAISQSIQAKGKVVRVNNGDAMTFEELYLYLSRIDTTESDLEILLSALESENEVISACRAVVNTGCLYDQDNNKGKVINRMPGIDSKFDTISPLKDVLLRIIDGQKGTSYLQKYGSNKTCNDTLFNDSLVIRDRFKSYFKYYSTIEACTIIMQGSLSTIKERAWVQPKVHSDSLYSFIEGLYGVSINSTFNYRVHASRAYRRERNSNISLIQTIYCTDVLNQVYKNSFEIDFIEEEDSYKTVNEVLNSIDMEEMDSNTKLKLGLLKYKRLKNKDMLDKYLESEQFYFKWVKTQQYINGKYFGDWELNFIVGNVSCNVRSIQGLIYIRANRNKINQILRGMKLVANRFFNCRPYEHDNNWYMSNVWRTIKPYPLRDQNGLFLTYVNDYVTVIQPKPTNKSIYIEFNRELKMDNMESFKIPDTYFLGDTLRTIDAEVHQGLSKPTKYRIGTIYQDFSLPDKDKIHLKMSNIQGYTNFLLYNSGVMEDLVLSRPFGVSKSKLSKILDGCNQGKNALPVWRMFRCLNNKIKKIGIPYFERTVNDGQEVETVVVTMKGRDTQEQAEMLSRIAPESLEFVALEHISPQVQSAKKLHYTPNITKHICIQLNSGYNEKNAIDFVDKLMCDPNIIKWIKDNRAQELGCPDSMIESIMTQEYISLELFSFIVGLGMDESKFWELKVNKQKIMEVREARSYSFRNESSLIKEFVDHLNDALFLDDLEEVESLLDLL